jgi:hypothetical protein
MFTDFFRSEAGSFHGVYRLKKPFDLGFTFDRQPYIRAGLNAGSAGKTPSANGSADVECPVLRSVFIGKPALISEDLSRREHRELRTPTAPNTA